MFEKKSTKKVGKPAKKAPQGREFGHLAPTLGKMTFAKSSGPRLHITARMDEYGEEMVADNDKTWRKKEVERLKKAISQGEKELKNLDKDDIAAKAERALKRDLASKKARLMEAEAFLED